MAAPRTDSQRERDRRLVSDLYLKGFNVQEIADRLGVHRNTIVTDLKAIKAEWKKQTNGLADEFEAKYRYIYREAISAWERSLLDAETTIQEMIDGGESGNGAGQRLKASTRKEGQSGNPGLLAQAQSALKAIREMRGFDAPTKHSQTDFVVTLEMLEKATAEQIDQLRAGVEPMIVFAVKSDNA